MPFPSTWGGSFLLFESLLRLFMEDLYGGGKDNMAWWALKRRGSQLPVSHEGEGRIVRLTVLEEVCAIFGLASEDTTMEILPPPPLVQPHGTAASISITKNDGVARWAYQGCARL
jgi:hypothetical protein